MKNRDPAHLLGSTVRVRLPTRHSHRFVHGEITGYGFPLVEIFADGRYRYRHVEDIYAANQKT